MNKYTLLSAALLGLLYGAKSRKGNDPALFNGFPGTLEIKHALPGRIRFFAPSLLQSARGKELLAERMQAIEGIEEVKVNTISGSILVLYQKEKIEKILIFGIIIKLLGLENKIQAKEVPLVRKEIRQWHEALSYSLYEKTRGLLDVKATLALVFLFYGIKGLFFSTEIAKANPYSLLYWAYRSLVLEGDHQ